MRMNKTFQQHGHEFDEDYTDSEVPAEIWINKKIGMGLRIEWFMLKKR